MYTKTLLALLLFSSLVYPQDMREKIVILDTGIVSGFNPTLLCQDGHKDFSGLGLVDYMNHGTHIAEIIGKYLDTTKQCLIIVKYYNHKIEHHSRGMLNALAYITTLHPKYINMSFGGDTVYAEEKLLIKGLLDNGVIIFAASGNSGKDLTPTCDFFPACYVFNNKQFHVVGSLTSEGKISSFSNYGKPVTDWCFGEFSFGRGTSYANAECLGRFLHDH